MDDGWWSSTSKKGDGKSFVAISCPFLGMMGLLLRALSASFRLTPLPPSSVAASAFASHLLPSSLHSPFLPAAEMADRHSILSPSNQPFSSPSLLPRYSSPTTSHPRVYMLTATPQIHPAKQPTTRSCYDCGFLCPHCSPLHHRTCQRCRGAYCLAHNEGCDERWVSRFNPLPHRRV
jgi:hypothetical protein